MIREFSSFVSFLTIFIFILHQKAGTCENGGLHFQIIPPTPSFIGRESILTQLHDSIQKSRSVQSDTADPKPNPSVPVKPFIKLIKGLGGIGKTQLLRKYVEKYGQTFTNLIWLNALEGEPALTSSFMTLKGILNPETLSTVSGPQNETSTHTNNSADPLKEDQKSKSVKEIVQEIYLRLCQDETLIIVDDIDDSMTTGGSDSPIENYLPLPLPPPLKQPIVILSSRNLAGSWKSSQNVDLISLESLTLQESRDFILGQLNLTEDDQNKAENLADLLGGIPLDLRLATSHIKATGNNIDNFVTLYAVCDSERKEEIVPGDDSDHPRSTISSTIWLATRKKLEQTPKDTSAIEVIETLSYLQPIEEIPADFLVALLKPDTDSLDIQKNENFQNSLSTLTKYGLIEKISVENQNSIRCEKEVQSIISEHIRQDFWDYLKTILQRAFQFVNSLETPATENTTHSKSQSQSYFTYLKSLESLAGKVKSQVVATVDLGYFHLLSYRPQVALLYSQIGMEDISRRLLEFCLRDLRGTMQNLFEHDITEQENLIWIVFAPFFQRHLNHSKPADEAENVKGKEVLGKFVQEIVEASQDILGESHPASLFLLRQMANISIEKNEFGEALKIYRQIYEIQTESLLKVGNVDENMETVGTLHKIAQTLIDAGDYDEASKVYLDLYEVEKTVAGVVNLENFDPISKLAGRFSLRQEYQKALGLLNFLMEMQEIAFGKHHPITLGTLRDIGRVHMEEGNFDVASKMFNQLYSIRNRTLGINHPDTIKAAGDLAKFYYHKQDFQNALRIYQQIQETQSKKFGSNHIESTNCSQDIADVYLTQMELKKALELYLKVYEFRKEKYGIHHVLPSETLERIGLVQIGQLKLKDSLETFRQVHQARSSQLGQSDSLTLSSWSLIGMSLLFQKDPEAENLNLEARGIFESLYSSGKLEPEVTAIQIGKICAVLSDKKRYEKAISLLQKMLDLQIDLLGQDSFEVISTLKELAHYSTLQGPYQEALKQAQRFVELSRSKFGLHHRETLKSLQALLKVYEKYEKFDQALIVQKEIYDMRQKLFGPTHWTTIASLRQVGVILGHLKNYEKQTSTFESVLELRRKFFKETKGRKDKLADAEDDLEVISAHFDLAQVLVSQKKLEDAVKAYVEIYKKRAQLLGEAHPDALNAYEKVADLLMEMGGNDEAKKIFKKIYSFKRKELGEVHNETISILFKMVEIHQRLNSTKEALRVLKIACDRSLKLMGLNHVKSKYCEEMTMRLYFLNGNLTEALRRAKILVKNRRQILGENHPETLESKLMWADLYQAQKKFDYAEDLYDDVYKRRAKLLGEQHPETMEILEKIAMMNNNDIKNYPEALELYNTIYWSTKRKFGDEHLETVKYLEIIAQIQYNMRNFEGSLETSRTVHKLRIKLLGDEHQDTLGTLRNIAGMLCEMGECRGDKGGLKILERVLRVKRRTLGHYHEETKSLDKTVREIKEKMAEEDKRKEESQQPQFKIQKMDL